MIADDAVHVVAYLGDVSGDGRVTASDASMVARVAALMDTGFAARRLVDPVLVGDVSGNGLLNAFDASLIARLAAGLGVADNATRIALGSVSMQTSQHVKNPMRIAKDAAPALIHSHAERMDWHRAEVDELMSSSSALWSEKSGEENAGGPEDGLDELQSALT